MKYVDFLTRHFGLHIAYTKEGFPQLELIENKKVVYNLTTITTFSQYATFDNCRTFIDLDKYPFAKELMNTLGCKSVRIFVGYNKRHPRNVVEYDITKIMIAQNKELKRDKMKRTMVSINSSFDISTLLVNYAVHKKQGTNDVYYLVTIDGSVYHMTKEMFVKAITTANIPVYKSLRQMDEFPKGDTYVRFN